MTDSNLQYIKKMIKIVEGYPNDIIEATMIAYICEKEQKKFTYQGEFLKYEQLIDKDLLAKIRLESFPSEIELLIEFFEALLDKGNINENGIVFTPKYITNYIDSQVMNELEEYSGDISIIDPGCGCGIFLVSAIEYLHAKFEVPIVDIINNNIYGIDLDEDNVRRCKIILNLLSLINGEDNSKVKVNIICEDSLKIKWNKVFNTNSFEFIVGNPPYVNTHDMTKETAKFLKDTFSTTKVGVYNIFYAFIEYGMEFLSSKGKLSYIVPNNFLTIKSATDLRSFIIKHKYLERIIDFADNMVFKPVRTYNCIIQLSKSNNEKFEYCVFEKCENIEIILNSIKFEKMEIKRMDDNGWRLVDKNTLANIQRIEGQNKPIKDFVRTGIATLKDEVYIVNFDGREYYKDIEGKRYVIESEVVKRLYKIPDLKKCDDIKNSCKYIIFPYIKDENGFKIIEEDILKESTPKTYEYLLERKEELDKRDKGKANPVAWYAYGRTQGLNKYGKKLVFPTFANKPRFTMIEDEYALFCNGYAVFENDYLELETLMRILNSDVMQYYITNTSYAIEGGYYCYQKKYIQNFSIPLFSDSEKEKIKSMNDEELNNFLIKIFKLNI